MFHDHCVLLMLLERNVFLVCAQVVQRALERTLGEKSKRRRRPVHGGSEAQTKREREKERVATMAKKK